MEPELDIRLRAWSLLRVHAHQLIAGGYGCLKPAALANNQEPEITGELCKAIREFMASSTAPDWTNQYALRDDSVIDSTGRLGKSRVRIDIEVERVQRGERPTFRFEAKRLSSKHSLGSYLGEDGLAAFVDGYYPLKHPEAGMLAYCQETGKLSWANLLAAKLETEREKHHQLPSDSLTEHTMAAELETWRSLHSWSHGGPLTIWHTFLRFY